MIVAIPDWTINDADLEAAANFKSVRDQIMDEAAAKLAQGITVNLIYNGEVVMKMYPDGITDLDGLRYLPNGSIGAATKR